MRHLHLRPGKLNGTVEELHSTIDVASAEGKKGDGESFIAGRGSQVEEFILTIHVMNMNNNK